MSPVRVWGKVTNQGKGIYSLYPVSIGLLLSRTASHYPPEATASGGGNSPSWDRKYTLSHSTHISAIRPFSMRINPIKGASMLAPVGGMSPIGPSMVAERVL